ncbi:MAG TPA: hypothetical protein VF600_15785 [Abditibacteriaceae bacterium]
MSRNDAHCAEPPTTSKASVSADVASGGVATCCHLCDQAAGDQSYRGARLCRVALHPKKNRVAHLQRSLQEVALPRRVVRHCGIAPQYFPQPRVTPAAMRRQVTAVTLTLQHHQPMSRPVHNHPLPGGALCFGRAGTVNVVSCRGAGYDHDACWRQWSEDLRSLAHLAERVTAHAKCAFGKVFVAALRACAAQYPGARMVL